MPSWAEEDDEELPPIPWLHECELIFDGPLPDAEVDEVEVPVTQTKSVVLSLQACPVSDAVHVAEVYLSQIPMPSYMAMIETTEKRARRYMYLPPGLRVHASVSGARLVIALLA